MIITFHHNERITLPNPIRAKNMKHNGFSKKQDKAYRLNFGHLIDPRSLCRIERLPYFCGPKKALHGSNSSSGCHSFLAASSFNKFRGLF